MVRYYEDFGIGDIETAGEYEVTEEEMVDFAKKWDPLPIHIDAEAAHASSHGGIIASGQYTLAVKQKLYTRTGFIGEPVIGAIEWNEVRFLSPVRPGHRLSLIAECLDKRTSNSRPDRGIVKFKVAIRTQQDETVLSYIGLVMVRKRPAGPARGQQE